MSLEAIEEVVLALLAVLRVSAVTAHNLGEFDKSLKREDVAKLRRVSTLMPTLAEVPYIFCKSRPSFLFLRGWRDTAVAPPFSQSFV